MRIRIQPLVRWFLAFAAAALAVRIFLLLPWWAELMVSIVVWRVICIFWMLARQNEERSDT